MAEREIMNQCIGREACQKREAHKRHSVPLSAVASELQWGVSGKTQTNKSFLFHGRKRVNCVIGRQELQTEDVWVSQVLQPMLVHGWRTIIAT